MTINYINEQSGPTSHTHKKIAAGDGSELAPAVQSVAIDSASSPVPIGSSTSGGLSTYRNISLSATGINIKPSAGQINGWYLFNNATGSRFVKFYDKATNPTVGTDTPLLTLQLPAGDGANLNLLPGIQFNNGIGIAATVNVGDSDTTAPSANDVVANVIFS